MDVAIMHPETGATVVVPQEALFHYRRSGWVTTAERAEQIEHENRLREQREQAQKQETAEPVQDQSGDGKTAGKKAAGFGAAGTE